MHNRKAAMNDILHKTNFYEEMWNIFLASGFVESYTNTLVVIIIYKNKL